MFKLKDLIDPSTLTELRDQLLEQDQQDKKETFVERVRRTKGARIHIKIRKPQEQSNVQS